MPVPVEEALERYEKMIWQCAFALGKSTALPRDEVDELAQ